MVAPTVIKKATIENDNATSIYGTFTLLMHVLSRKIAKIGAMKQNTNLNFGVKFLAKIFNQADH